MNGWQGKQGYLYLAIIALLSGGLVKLTEVNESTRLSTQPTHSPDYFSKRYEKRIMDTQGQLNSHLIADEMIHYSDDHTTQTRNLTLLFYNAKSPLWEIKAETGILSADGQTLLLNGHVSLTRSAATGFKALKINTSNVRVSPQSHYAETNEWVELLSPPNRTTGTGMKLIFVDPIHLELLAHVKGNYETK
jgi:lipopolysaccharide export system protein LptC